eukprot:Rhum_TRINITY_DN14266_c21_g1::Rhum_TRINITY_DN14266_c21_g1_i1::g.78967::m.78967
MTLARCRQSVDGYRRVKPHKEEVEEVTEGYAGKRHGRVVVRVQDGLGHLNEHDTRQHHRAVHHEVRGPPTVLVHVVLLHDREPEPEHEERVQHGAAQPHQSVPDVRRLVTLRLVQQRAGLGIEERLLVQVLVEAAHDEGRCPCEDRVLDGEQPRVEDGLCGEAGVARKVDLAQRQHDVLVEREADALREPELRVPPVHREQALQVPETGDRVGGRQLGRASLHADDADADVRHLDHRHVVAAVADGEHAAVAHVVVFDAAVHDRALHLRRQPCAHDGAHPLGECVELLPVLRQEARKRRFVGRNRQLSVAFLLQLHLQLVQHVACDERAPRLCRTTRHCGGHALIRRRRGARDGLRLVHAEGGALHLRGRQRGRRLRKGQLEDLVGVCRKLAALRDLNGGLQLVACKHPHHDVRVQEELDRLRHLGLQLILVADQPTEDEVALQRQHRRVLDLRLVVLLLLTLDVDRRPADLLVLLEPRREPRRVQLLPPEHERPPPLLAVLREALGSAVQGGVVGGLLLGRRLRAGRPQLLQELNGLVVIGLLRRHEKVGDHLRVACAVLDAVDHAVPDAVVIVCALGEQDDLTGRRAEHDAHHLPRRREVQHSQHLVPHLLAPDRHRDRTRRPLRHRDAVRVRRLHQRHLVGRRALVRDVLLALGYHRHHGVAQRNRCHEPLQHSLPVFNAPGLALQKRGRIRPVLRNVGGVTGRRGVAAADHLASADDGTSDVRHLVLSQRARLVREDVLDVGKVGVEVGGLRLAADPSVCPTLPCTAHPVVHLVVDGHQHSLHLQAELDGDKQRDGDHERKQDKPRQVVQEEGSRVVVQQQHLFHVPVVKVAFVEVDAQPAQRNHEAVLDDEDGDHSDVQHTVQRVRPRHEVLHVLSDLCLLPSVDNQADHPLGVAHRARPPDHILHVQVERDGPVVVVRRLLVGHPVHARHSLALPLVQLPVRQVHLEQQTTPGVLEVLGRDEVLRLQRRTLELDAGLAVQLGGLDGDDALVVGGVDDDDVGLQRLQRHVALDADEVADVHVGRGHQHPLAVAQDVHRVGVVLLVGAVPQEVFVAGLEPVDEQHEAEGQDRSDRRDRRHAGNQRNHKIHAEVDVAEPLELLEQVQRYKVPPVVPRRNEDVRRVAVRGDVAHDHVPHLAGVRSGLRSAARLRAVLRLDIFLAAALVVEAAERRGDGAAVFTALVAVQTPVDGRGVWGVRERSRVGSGHAKTTPSLC